MKPLLAMLALWLAFYFFTTWQALVLIGIGGLILAVLSATGHWKPVRRFEFDATRKDDKKEAWEKWAVIPAKQQFRRDVCIFGNLADYHMVFEYKIDRERVSMRLVEDTIEPAGKPILYRVRDGVVGTSWIADYYPRMPELGVEAVERLKKDVDWQDAPQRIRYFILKHTSGHHDFLCSERKRLTEAFAYVDGEIKRLALKRGQYGDYVSPDGTKSDAAEKLLSDDNLNKYGITSDEFCERELLLRILPRF